MICNACYTCGAARRQKIDQSCLDLLLESKPSVRDLHMYDELRVYAANTVMVAA